MSKRKIAEITVCCILGIILVAFVAGCNSPPEPTISLTYQADLTGIEPGTEGEIMNSVKAVVEGRINALGITKSSVQVQKQGDEYNIVIQISGSFDTEKVLKMMPLFSVLEFQEQDATGNWTPATGTVNGQNLTLGSRYFKQNTSVDLDAYGRPLVVFEWDETGAQLSEQITTRLLGEPLAIYLGDEPLRGKDGQIIAPIVMAVITDKGQIEGLSLADATELRDLLNSGRIEVPLGFWAEQGQSRVFVPNIPAYEQVTG
jgi:preprotein translocase subunit SecD